MKTYHVGDLIVCETRQTRRLPIAILTDRDLALAVASHASRLPFLRVADLMKRPLVIALESDSLHGALKKMQTSGVRRLPVVAADGTLEGIITLDDIIELLSEELTDLTRLVLREQRKERQGIES
jgi:CBS domain-containing protein